MMSAACAVTAQNERVRLSGDGAREATTSAPPTVRREAGSAGGAATPPTRRRARWPATPSTGWPRRSPTAAERKLLRCSVESDGESEVTGRELSPSSRSSLDECDGFAPEAATATAAAEAARSGAGPERQKREAAELASCTFAPMRIMDKEGREGVKLLEAGGLIGDGLS